METTRTASTLLKAGKQKQPCIPGRMVETGATSKDLKNAGGESLHIPVQFADWPV